MLLLLLSQNLLELSCASLHCTAFGPLGEKFLISLLNHNPTKTQLTPTVHLWLEEALGVPSHIDLYLMLFLCLMDLTVSAEQHSKKVCGSRSRDSSRVDPTSYSPVTCTLG